MPSFDSTSLGDEEMTHSTAPDEEHMVLEIQDTVDDDPKEQESDLPAELPILPVRGLVVYPLTQVPITVGQPRSRRLVEDAVLTEPRTIGIVTSRNPEEDEPAPDEVYRVGTAVHLRHVYCL